MQQEQRHTRDNVLDRDRKGTTSVYAKKGNKPSYTHNADKSAPVDPHLSDSNAPKRTAGSGGIGDKELDRDRSAPVSVSPSGSDKPSYTHNADKSDPIDPNLADQSGHSK